MSSTRILREFPRADKISQVMGFLSQTSKIPSFHFIIDILLHGWRVYSCNSRLIILGIARVRSSVLASAPSGRVGMPQPSKDEGRATPSCTGRRRIPSRIRALLPLFGKRNFLTVYLRCGSSALEWMVCFTSCGCDLLFRSTYRVLIGDFRLAIWVVIGSVLYWSLTSQCD